MAIYTLTFDVSAAFSAGMPKLQIKFGGVKLDTTYVGSGASTLSYQIDTDGPFDHSLLRFYFVKNYGSSGDNIDISNVRINGDPVDLSAFTHNKGSSGNASSISLTQGSYSDYNAQTDIPEVPPLNPPSGPQASITGTNGADIIYGTNDAGDTIDALDGNDRVTARDGNDTVNGGDGNDIITGQGGNDILNGDAGDDRIYGNDGDDQIDGGDDNDILYGHDGQDTIDGGAGNDKIYGGNDNDTIYGRGGNDILSGQDGDDIIEGHGGSDQIFGGDGDDTIRGGQGADRLLGNNGNDTIYGDDGVDNIDGQLGNDTIYGGNNDDTIDGEQGNDNLNGDDGNDYIIGGQGSDTLNGGAGNDILYGGGISSYDQYVIRENSAWGRAGLFFNEQTQSFYRFDTTTVSVGAAITNAAATNLEGIGGHLVNITSATENAFINTMIGGNTIWLGATDADIEGEWEWMGGAEAGSVFYRGAVGGTPVSSHYENWNGNEPNDSGGAEDYAEYRNDDVWNDQQTGSRRTVIEWNADEIMPDNNTDTLNGGDGDDQLYGGAGDDILNGDADDDILYGGTGNDSLNGGTGNDALYGQNGNDTINGGTGNDEIYGQDGNDNINGGDGDDLIYGDTDASVQSNGWNYEYYDYESGTNPNNLASAGFTLNGGRDNNFTLTGSGITSDLNPALIDNGDYYSIKYEAILTISTAGTYRFRTASDDGSALFLNGVQIVNNDGLHGTATVTSAAQNLTAGTYTLEATYFERTGGNTMDVLLSGPDTGGGYVSLGNYSGISPLTPIIASGGNDIITGGDGLDTLYGGGGADTFVFDASDAYNDTDIIMDFSNLDNDRLDISDLLTNWVNGDPTYGNITNYLNFVNSGGNTLIQVDANGVWGGSSFTTVGQLNNVTGLDESTLYGNGQIIA